MGCDIHPVLEKRWANPETDEVKWVGVHAFPYITIPSIIVSGKKVAENYWFAYRAQGRDYALFAALAGVRGKGPDPKGLPEDASDLARMELDHNDDLHSHSWATAREWVQACLATERDPQKLFLAPDNDDPRVKDPYKHYLELELDDDESPDEYRIVFAFDN